MDLASFAEIMHGVKRTENFLYCFAHMVAGACAIIRSYNHENNQKKQRAKFVFDSDNDKFNAGYLYSVLTKMKRWEEITADCEDSVEFAFNPKPAGIQAADLWVYEVRNEFDNKLKSINTKTYASHILSPEYPRFLRNEYFRSNIIGSKNRIDQMGNESQYLDAYKEWLLKHHRQDNPTSKIAFTAYWDVLHKKE
jgi:hypothetical protein